MLKNSYQKPIKSLFDELQSEQAGLSSAEAKQRLLKWGENSLSEEGGSHFWKILLGQFQSVLVIILLLAAVLSWFLGEHVDAVAIFAIVLVNAVFGFIQEYKADRAIEELKKINTLSARVFRDEKEQSIDARFLVPGDVIALYEGEQVPADCRLIEAYSLEVDESLLTGESLPVYKEVVNLERELPLAERKNSVFSSCMIVRGRGKAVVLATGMQTEIGQLAAVIQSSQEEITPLQKALDILGKRIALISAFIVIPVLVLDFLKERDIWHAIILAISLAVSSIPEGLPVVVTITLALGVKRMLKAKVLIKKLSAVESLGGVNVICSDKTGTITKNQMSVHSLFLPKNGFFNFPKNLSLIQINQALNKKFAFTNASKKESEVLTLMRSAVLCSDAHDDFGDPTELALVELFKAQKGENQGLNNYKRVAEIPFSSENRYMAVAVKHQGTVHAIIKGAPEVVFKNAKVTAAELKILNKINLDFASRGFRVLAVAAKKISPTKSLNDQQALVGAKNYEFLGLIALHDPAREEVLGAIKKCQDAGIRVLMLTGDQAGTAQAIAKQVGLDADQVILGQDLDKLNQADFMKVVNSHQVFARVSPKNKVAILEILQKQGLQVAMTGDGVNDAPALKRAEVGVAVGSGTDLTKSVADIIILDDNFATIVAGVEEGRHIFFNIKKFVRFLLSANFDEVLCILASLVLGLPLVFLPIHILWINLVTDSFPALALGADRAEDSIMTEPPYDSKKEILNGVISYAFLAGLLAFVVTITAFLLCLFFWKESVNYAQTMSLTVTVFFELFLVYTVRFEKSSLKKDLFSNPWLNLAVLLVFVLQTLAIYSPFLQQYLNTTALSLEHFLTSIALGSFAFWGMELMKYMIL